MRLHDGNVLTIDGPYTEGKEHIGGFCIIKATDLDGALGWGRKLARAIPLPIEVRRSKRNARTDTWHAGPPAR